MISNKKLYFLILSLFFIAFLTVTESHESLTWLGTNISAFRVDHNHNSALKNCETLYSIRLNLPIFYTPFIIIGIYVN